MVITLVIMIIKRYCQRMLNVFLKRFKTLKKLVTLRRWGKVIVKSKRLALKMRGQQLGLKNKCTISVFWVAHYPATNLSHPKIFNEFSRQSYTARHFHQCIIELKNTAIGKRLLEAHGSLCQLNENQLAMCRRCFFTLVRRAQSTRQHLDRIYPYEAPGLRIFLTLFLINIVFPSGEHLWLS